MIIDQLIELLVAFNRHLKVATLGKQTRRPTYLLVPDLEEIEDLLRNILHRADNNSMLARPRAHPYRLICYQSRHQRLGYTLSLLRTFDDGLGDSILHKLGCELGVFIQAVDMRSKHDKVMNCSNKESRRFLELAC